MGSTPKFWLITLAPNCHVERSPYSEKIEKWQWIRMWVFIRRLLTIILLSEFFNPLVGRARSRGSYWAAIRLSHLAETSDRAIHEEVNALDIGGQHGWRFVSAPHSKVAKEAIPFVQAGAETSDTGAEAVKPDPGSSWEGHSGRVGTGVRNENAESCDGILSN